MEENLRNQEQEMSFKEAFEAYESETGDLRAGEIVKGRIIGYNTSEVFVDLGYKSDGTIPLEEFLDDPDFDLKRI
ncbi:S1 RNA-binding domain-containing protein [Thermoclostridium stercorarium]|uniref:S1 RNA-binding domain-containing protein n=1 Tax=Thermoclostridium stercorarium TaxID=1510 RepID=UPI00396A4A99